MAHPTTSTPVAYAGPVTASDSLPVVDRSAVEMVSAIRSRETTAVDLTEAVLARMANREVHAFTHVAAERAMAQAWACDRRIREGEVPQLAGVPVPIKDLAMVAGVPMQAGSAALAGFVPDVDDGVVTLLERAGAIMVGKTATPEFGLPAYTETDIAPPPINPWDPTRSPGGSSGGAGAAVGARIVPMAHGSDGGGSIRIPAGACGLVGLKVTRGRISSGPHGVEGAALSTQGALTRTVADQALALDVLCAPWPGDDRLLPRLAGGYLAHVLAEGRAEPLRIGVLLEPIVGKDTEVHPEALAAVDRAVAVLGHQGHAITPVGVPFGQADWDPFLDVWSVMAGQAPVPEPMEDRLVPLTRWMRARAKEVSGVGYANAIANGQMLQRRAAIAWADVDVVLSPTLAWPAARIGSIRNDADPYADFVDQCRYTPWTSTWNIIGAPSISVPLHSAVVDGVELPFGIMLGARTGREDVLLRLAADLEAADPWAGRIPPIAAS